MFCLHCDEGTRGVTWIVGCGTEVKSNAFNIITSCMHTFYV